MKPYYLYIIIFFLGFIACNNDRKNNDSQEQDEISNLHEEDDTSTKNIAEFNDSKYTLEEETYKDTLNKPHTAGTHLITLQWIGWDKPGKVKVEPIDKLWYSIDGFQTNNDGDSLKITGKIKRISEKRLQFNGVIFTIVKHNNNGKTCIKQGIQYFYAAGDRKYYRLQNMVNCEGGKLLDYVDIYEGDSSL